MQKNKGIKLMISLVCFRGLQAVPGRSPALPGFLLNTLLMYAKNIVCANITVNYEVASMRANTGG